MRSWFAANYPYLTDDPRSIKRVNHLYLRFCGYGYLHKDFLLSEVIASANGNPYVSLLSSPHKSSKRRRLFWILSPRRSWEDQTDAITCQADCNPHFIYYYRCNRRIISHV